MLSGLASSLQRALTIVGVVYLILTVAIATILCIAIFFLVRMGVEFFRFRGRRKLSRATSKAEPVIQLLVKAPRS